MPRKKTDKSSKKSSQKPAKPVDPSLLVPPTPLPQIQQRPAASYGSNPQRDPMGPLARSFGLMSTGSEIQVSPTAYAYPPPLAGAGGEEVGYWQNAATQAGISVPVNPVHYQLGSQLGLGSLGVSQLGAASRKNDHKRQESNKTYIPVKDLPPAKLEKKRASRRKSYHKLKNDPIRGPALAKKSTENHRAWRADPWNKERININQRERREKKRREKGTHAAQGERSGEDNPQGGPPADGPSGNNSSDGDEPSDDDLSSEDPNDEDSSDEERFYVPPTQARRKRHADVLDNDSEYLLETQQPIAGFIVPEDESQFQPYLPPPAPFGSGHPQTQPYFAPRGSPASSNTQMQPYLSPPAPLASGYPQTQLYSAPVAPPGSGYVDPALLMQYPRGFDADQAAAARERGEKVSQAKKKPGGSSEKPKRK